MKKKVYFIQINNIIADAVFLPLSVAYIWEYCRSLEDIRENWELGGIIFERKNISEILEEIKIPDVIAISCYVWNWEISKTLAKTLKNKYPNCKIVLGGPQPPYSKKWIHKNSYVDYVVAYSGEYAFRDILRCKTSIPGVYCRDYDYIKPDPIENLDDIPSPYLSGLMNSLMRPNIKYSAIIETNRGCPYKCSFCDQEADYYTKIYKFNFDRVIKEIDWLSENNIEFAYFADSNLGIFNRDINFMKRIAHNRKNTGYPRQIDYSTAKQQPSQILELGKILNHEAGIKRGVTIALQSLNFETLKSIKRINLANDKLEQVVKNYNNNGIDNYCELILGLPEETVDSWIKGIDKILEIGSDHALTMHPLSVVPNTPFGTEEYKKKYGLKYAKTKAPAGSNFYENEIYEEYDYICYESNTMTKEEWIECYFFTKGIIIPHHYHGVSQVAAEYLNRIYKIPLINFYKTLYEFSKKSSGILNHEYIEHKRSVEGSINNQKYWGRKIGGNFYFQDNAATAACLYKNIEEVHKEINIFIRKTFNIDIQEPLRYNRLILDTYDKKIYIDMFDKNFDTWFKNKQDLINVQNKVVIEKKNHKSFENHAMDLFWFGRKSKRCYLQSQEIVL